MNHPVLPGLPPIIADIQPDILSQLPVEVNIPEQILSILQSVEHGEAYGRVGFTAEIDPDVGEAGANGRFGAFIESCFEVKILLNGGFAPFGQLIFIVLILVLQGEAEVFGRLVGELGVEAEACDVVVFGIEEFGIADADFVGVTDLEAGLAAEVDAGFEEGFL